MGKGEDNIANYQMDKPARTSRVKHSGLMHTVMMAVCCLAPLAAVFILNKMGYGNSATFLMLLLCPLMHFFMMRGRHGTSQVAGDDAEK